MGWVSKPPPGLLMLVCGPLHSLAKKAYERTLTAASERTPGQPDALSAILLSVASLEALMGELVEVVRGLLPNYPEDSRNRGKALIDALELIEEGKPLSDEGPSASAPSAVDLTEQKRETQHTHMEVVMRFFRAALILALCGLLADTLTAAQGGQTSETKTNALTNGH